MKRDDTITLTEWNKLEEDAKEKLRSWAVQNSIELDLVPGAAGQFDPVCEYAALLNREQLCRYLTEHGIAISQKEKKERDINRLWSDIVKKANKMGSNIR